MKTLYPDNLDVFRERIRKARNELNLTQTELQEKINDYFPEYYVSGGSQIGKWERGERIPDLISCLHLCSALEKNFDYLAGVSDIPNNENYFISEKTGLTEKAVSIIRAEKNNDISVNSLNALIESGYFFMLLSVIVSYLDLPDVENLETETDENTRKLFLKMGRKIEIKDKRNGTVIDTIDIEYMFFLRIMNILSIIKNKWEG